MTSLIVDFWGKHKATFYLWDVGFPTGLFHVNMK